MQNPFAITEAWLLGGSCGLRTAGAPAALAVLAAGESPLAGSPLDWARRHPIAATALASEGLELLADLTLPLPSRLKPAVLLGRVATGTVCGALGAARRRQDQRGGALAGALAALLVLVTTTPLRAAITRRGVPDAVPALLEDGLMVWLLWQACRVPAAGNVQR